MVATTDRTGDRHSSGNHLGLLKEAGVTLRLPRGRLVPAKPAMNEVTRPTPKRGKTGQLRG